MPNKIQIKRTTTSGLLPNVSNSSNTTYIAAGELAINLTDKKLLSSNGSATFEVGANLATIVVGTAFTQTSGNANFDSGLLFVDGTNDRVGIGTSSPSFALDVSQSAPRIRQTATTGTNSSLIQLVNSGGTAYVGLDSSVGGLTSAYSLNMYHSGAYPIAFSTSGTERMRITDGGNVGIGNSTPSSKLVVAGAVELGNTTITGFANVSSTLAAGNTTVTGFITATGDITAFFSDDRLKDRYSNIPNAVEKVKLLNGFYYEPNITAQDLGYQKEMHVGVSAQEVNAIMPEIVAPAPIDNKYLTVKYDRLVPLLIEAIKEQQTQIDELKAQLNKD